MNKIVSSSLACFLLISFSHASIQSGINKLIKNVDPTLNIGIEIVDLNTGKTLYSRNSNRPYIPASNMKLFSEAASLMLLGPDYRFISYLSTDANKLQGHVLNGNLYLHLPGDPSFSSKKLSVLFHALKQLEIKKINGNIIINSNLKGIEPYGPGWMSEDLIYSYGAPLTPVIIDQNRLTVTLNPADKPGKPAIIEYDDPSGTILLKNKVKTASTKKNCGIHFMMDEQNHLKLQGCLRQSQWAMQQGIAIHNPLLYLKGLIKKQLSTSNTKITGKIKLGNMPKDTLLIASTQSRPISQLMTETLKSSDNLFAESLFLHAAKSVNKTPVNWEEAKNLVTDFLQKQTGINMNKAVLADGSGLSRYNLITPHQTVQLLQFLHSRFPFSYEFIAALPIAGRDGTLQRRLKKPSQQDLLRAKTGTMKGIISLSGYLYTANGHTLAFAIYINNYPGTKPAISSQYRYLVDAISGFLLKQKPKMSRLAKIVLPHGRFDYQQLPTVAKQQRKRNYYWRKLETNLKKKLRGAPVMVLYRNHEMVLFDNYNNANTIWNVLQSMKRKHDFAVILKSPALPKLAKGKPRLLWIQYLQHHLKAKRVWTLKQGTVV